jgi:hypothetical protein
MEALSSNYAHEPSALPTNLPLEALSWVSYTRVIEAIDLEVSYFLVVPLSTEPLPVPVLPSFFTSSQGAYAIFKVQAVVAGHSARLRRVSAHFGADLD